ncbi:enoyl-CoA hydratase/isomerase family protein [Actinacidiphila bryophytorum]|uniref:Enoyl-CoA hydratase/carnithine racemase n=1 Tax=Actinacidiphila bryophytorum TaxID=1436133 RepID=A0A9W4H5V1_9ACTN|nr:enoyl-CoA hydratase-related protein [Actinacidiphila bryophytorum]MBM9439665.1 enoyl-CoA hydratase/isomerase family protein [Actinacidiphila bryophytorum]CAG7653086.1 Enoyl-CoA hydratase/carnithine racemase [Actinacidiphila bryophytorum]
MTTPPRLTVATADGTATVTIDNPARRNAMTPAMWESLPALLAPLAADPAVRVLVLTGAGDTFCAGADISGFTDADGLRAARTAAVAAEEALAAFPKPTLAAVRGHCVGGGCQLAVACDLRFAAHGATFGVTPARLGIVYPAASTRRLVRLAGPSTAKHLLFSAELIDHERALRVGLVDEVCPADGLDGRVRGYASLLASRSLLTQYAAKEFAGDIPGDSRSAYWAAQAATSTDALEGATAFLTRRPPSFTWTPPLPG